MRYCVLGLRYTFAIAWVECIYFRFLEIRKGYFITEATGLCSDTGHMAVDDIDTCKEAAEELKRKFGGVEDSAIRLNGCHVHDNDVFFNQKSTGYGSWLASQICKPKGKV